LPESALPPLLLWLLPIEALAACVCVFASV